MTKSSKAAKTPNHNIDEIFALVTNTNARIITLTEEVKELKAINATQNKKIDDLKRDYESLFAENTALRERIEALEHEMNNVLVKNDALEQYTRKKSLEIVGIPPTTNTSCEEIIIEVSNKIGLISKRDSPPILVKFISHKKKSELYRARTKF